MHQRRGALARIGVALLNLLVPGLGMLRLGRWQAAALLFVTSLTLPALLFLAPPLPFAAFAAIAALGFGIYPVAVGITWVFGREIRLPRDWYSRWYVITAAALGAMVLNFTLTDPDRALYRSFYTPAEGMAPTHPIGDRFIAYMAAPKALRRGDVLLIRARGGTTYVKRLAGLPGDLISVEGGIVILNGRPIGQKLVASEHVKNELEAVPAKRLEEQFPGETKPHQIYDMGQSAGDNFGPVRVRAGHYFMMGDNRDRSADSRFGPEQWGLDQIRANDILGRPLYHSWGSSKPIGTPIANKL